jgi:hypothetical protein
MTTEIIFERGWSWGALVVTAIVVGVLLWQGYRWMIVPISGKQRASLLALRLVWSLLLLWCIWQPALETVILKDESVPPQVAVMVDVSASMALTDEQGADRWQALKDTVKRLGGILDGAGVKGATWFACGAQLRPWKEDLPPKDDQSLIIQQVREVAEKQDTSGAIKALFLLTDGEDTTETPVTETLAALRARSVRVFPIAPEGSIRPPSLIRVERILAPQQVFLNQAFEIAADLRLRNSVPVDFAAVLECNGKEIARQPQHHQGDGTTRVSFQTKADAAGIFLYTVRLVRNDTKADVAHMSASVLAKTRDPLKVLYVQQGTEWEYRYVRQAVSDNPAILMEAIVQLGNEAFLRQAAQGTTQPENTPQATIRVAAQNQDVVVLANVSPAFLDLETQKALADLVVKRGGGLLFFTGDGAQASRFSNTPMEEVLPILFEPTTAAAAATAPVAMQITTDGLSSEIWRDAAAPNVALAQPPPTFTRFARARSVKPGAMILGIHPQEKIGGQPAPLLVSQNMGAGRSAFFGVDSLWRWRMMPTTQNRDYDRFWQQLLLWLGGRVQGTSIEIDRARYHPGETAHLKVRTIKSDVASRLLVRDSAGKETDVTVAWNPTATEGKVDYPLPAPGELIFVVRRGNDILAQQVVDVRTVDLELEHAGLNEALLQQLAKDNGGQCLTSKDLDLVPSLLKSSHRKYDQRSSRSLWHLPWIFGILLAAYGTELLLRKKFQLV